MKADHASNYNKVKWSSFPNRPFTFLPCDDRPFCPGPDKEKRGKAERKKKKEKKKRANFKWKKREI